MHVRFPTAGRYALAALLVCLATSVAAQSRREVLPTLFVTDTRLGVGIVGASTTVIDSVQIERSPAQSLPEILSREPGVQVRRLFGGNGARDSVDLRGFGAAGSSNTLVLINGRRINDIDIAAVDLASIPLHSIERIEITRGNSGAVLYGDGAVGGVINIVTKNGVGVPPSAKVEGLAGSYRTGEGRVAVTAGSGPVAAAAFGNAFWTDGYRFNSEQRQYNGVGDLRYSWDRGSLYLNVSADDQHVGLPGGRRVMPGSNLVVTDPRGAATPFDYADKQGVNATTGVSYLLSPGNELIIDGGVRRKTQQAGFFSSFGAAFDRYVEATLTTWSVTPRLNSEHDLLGMRGKAILGVDYYDSSFGSDRAVHLGDPPNHRYDLRQRTLGAYAQETLSLGPATDVSFGARVQRNMVSARDRLDAAAPGGLFAEPQGLPLDFSETQHAWHLGIEHRLMDSVAVFARAARSFRLPNVDERVAVAPVGTPTNFALRTQTSHDYEAGIRLQGGGVTWQTSAYLMDLNDELHFSPATFTNVNLDPTRRYGVESLLTVQASERLRLFAGVAYTRAVFREGPFAGNDIPLVSPWSGSAGFSWDIIPRALVVDAIARYSGERRLDNDQRNIQPLIPASTVVDLRVGGEVRPHPGAPPVTWSVSVLNLFDANYYDYGIASAFLLGVFDAYPQPRRAVMVRVGAAL